VPSSSEGYEPSFQGGASGDYVNDVKAKLQAAYPGISGFTDFSNQPGTGMIPGTTTPQAPTTSALGFHYGGANLFAGQQPSTVDALLANAPLPIGAAASGSGGAGPASLGVPISSAAAGSSLSAGATSGGDVTGSNTTASSFPFDPSAPLPVPAPVPANTGATNTGAVNTGAPLPKPTSDDGAGSGGFSSPISGGDPSDTGGTGTAGVTGGTPSGVGDTSTAPSDSGGIGLNGSFAPGSTGLSMNTVGQMGTSLANSGLGPALSLGLTGVGLFGGPVGAGISAVGKGLTAAMNSPTLGVNARSLSPQQSPVLNFSPVDDTAPDAGPVGVGPNAADAAVTGPEGSNEGVGIGATSGAGVGSGTGPSAADAAATGPEGSNEGVGVGATGVGDAAGTAAGQAAADAAAAGIGNEGIGLGEGDGGGGGGGGGGSVICTLLAERGLIDERRIRANHSYVRRMGPEAFAGYRRWAGPMVRLARRNPVAFHVLYGLGRPLIQAYMTEIEFKGGYRARGSRLGRAILAVAVPFSRWLGHRRVLA
jgi:hypothetical protein